MLLSLSTALVATGFAQMRVWLALTGLLGSLVPYYAFSKFGETEETRRLHGFCRRRFGTEGKSFGRFLAALFADDILSRRIVEDAAAAMEQLRSERVGGRRYRVCLKGAQAGAFLLLLFLTAGPYALALLSGGGRIFDERSARVYSCLGIAASSAWWLGVVVSAAELWRMPSPIPPGRKRA